MNSEILRTYVDNLNRGVEHGDFSRLVDLFSPDAQLAFPTIGIGPFSGRDDIALALTTHPPSDRLRIREPIVISMGVLASYEWDRQPGVTAGIIRATFAEGLITRMVIITAIERAPAGLPPCSGTSALGGEMLPGMKLSDFF